MPTQEEKTQALLMWILTLFIPFIGPLIFLLISKEKPFVYQSSAYALALSVVLTIIAIILIVTIVGALLLPLVGLASLVAAIMGAMKANNGEIFKPPLTSGLAKAVFKDLP